MGYKDLCCNYNYIMSETRYIVYQITDDNMYYIGSSSLSLARRKAAHHDAFKDDHIQWKLYKYWRSVGWENMRFEVLQDEIGIKEEKRKAEQWFINQIIRHKLLNQIKADCPNYEATRSINSPQGEIKKIEMKRKNRRDHYARKKNDEEWMNKYREKNKLRMRERRQKHKSLMQPHESVSTTERAFAGEDISNPQ